ncbi:hypothetical protein ACN28S_57015 [Cystobacter fuscus]
MSRSWAAAFIAPRNWRWKALPVSSASRKTTRMRAGAAGTGGAAPSRSSQGSSRGASRTARRHRSVVMGKQLPLFPRAPGKTPGREGRA